MPVYAFHYVPLVFYTLRLGGSISNKAPWPFNQCFYPAGTGLGFFVDLVNGAAIQFFLARSLAVQFSGPTAREQIQSAQYKI